jgi:hypothetical protein
MPPAAALIDNCYVCLPAGRRSRAVPHRLVVDVREFMSGLPAVLHTQGFKLTPITLEVGVCARVLKLFLR